MAGNSWVVTMPKLGETVTEGTVGGWLKSVGDTVAFDDPLFEVSNDKVTSEIPSPYDGVILEIMVAEGETVPIGTELVRIGEAGGVAEPAPAEAPAPAAAPVTGGVMHEITMPKLGETVSEGTVGAWLKDVGDTVAFDDPLFEVSSDKVNSEIPSPFDGVLVEILVPAGETVPINTVVARISEAGAVAASAPAATAPAATTSAASAAPAATAGKLYSPIVRRLAAENNIDLSTLTGTGEGGRIRRQDVEEAIAKGPAAVPVQAAAAPVQTAAPVQAAAPAPKAAAPAAAAQPAVFKVPGTNDPRDTTVKMSPMRVAVAEGMMNSIRTAPQVFTSVEVDYENVARIRAKHKKAFKEKTGASLSYLPFVARATCDALMEMPPVNSSIDMDSKTITLHPYVNLGIAVDMNEDGLIVPVIKNADQLNIRGIAQQIKQKADDGRARKLPPADMRGSTFTITNPGHTYVSGPIINQPNVAILASEGISRKPVAVGDMIAIHHVGVVSLVYDHRAFDGVLATRFMLRVKEIIETRDWETELGL